MANIANDPRPIRRTFDRPDLALIANIRAIVPGARQIGQIERILAAEIAAYVLLADKSTCLPNGIVEIGSVDRSAR